MTDGAAIPFTPPHYSLNRARVVDLPGISMDDEVRGQTGFALLSAWALMGYARERAGELELPASLLEDTAHARWELPRLIGALLAQPDSGRTRAATRVAERLGRNLGHLLLMLLRGDPVNREARPEWGDAEWARWAGVRRVWLAGGLASGELGAAIQRAANGWLAGAGAPVIVSLSPWGESTALVGAARYLPPACDVALCCDYGQTSVKRAVVAVKDTRVTSFARLPRIAAPDDRRNTGAGDLTREGEVFREFVVETVCEALANVGDRAAPREVILSFAAYVDGGRLLGSGLYAAMSRLAPDTRGLLADALFERAGARCRIRLIHDGTAAAAAFAGQPNSVAIAMGSALGVGFPPERAGHLLTIEEISHTR